MEVQLAYGQGGLTLSLPDSADVTVVEPRHVPGLLDEGGVLQDALRSPVDSLPLREVARGKGQVAIVVSDVTRPMPTARILPPILETLGSHRGVVLIIATGIHRPSSPQELQTMLGGDILLRYPIVQHNTRDRSTMTSLGVMPSGHELWVNRDYQEADVRILTGLIEPHFFAGFSGGPKAVLPGIADSESIIHNHSAANLDHPKATWGITKGNPIYMEMMEAALRSDPSFLVNVTANRDGAITGVFAGSLAPAHEKGTSSALQNTMRAVDAPFDIVITSNSGYPLDLNLYQGIKGLSAAGRIVRPGGAIILAAECRDGIPDDSNYGRILHMADSPQTLLDIVRHPSHHREGAWQAHIQALVQLKAQVFIHSRCLTSTQIQKALLLPCVDLQATVKDLLRDYGPQARVAVLPEGPRTIPYLAG